MSTVTFRVLLGVAIIIGLVAIAWLWFPAHPMTQYQITHFHTPSYLRR